jgi:hypothetical protein
MNTEFGLGSCGMKQQIRRLTRPVHRLLARRPGRFILHSIRDVMQTFADSSELPIHDDHSKRDHRECYVNFEKL